MTGWRLERLGVEPCRKRGSPFEVPFDPHGKQGRRAAQRHDVSCLTNDLISGLLKKTGIPAFWWEANGGFAPAPPGF